MVMDANALGTWRAAVSTPPPPLSVGLRRGRSAHSRRGESVPWALGDETAVAVLFVRGSPSRLQRNIGGGVGLGAIVARSEACGSSARSQQSPIFRWVQSVCAIIFGFETLGRLSRVIA